MRSSQDIPRKDSIAFSRSPVFRSCPLMPVVGSSATSRSTISSVDGNSNEKGTHSPAIRKLTRESQVCRNSVVVATVLRIAAVLVVRGWQLSR